MAPSLKSFFFLLAISLFSTRYLVDAATCSDCFIRSRAAYYLTDDNRGTITGACGYGRFGRILNNGLVSAASDLYRGGLGCGACYQVRCTNSTYCSDKGVNVVITDQGSSDRTDFILNVNAFARMAPTPVAAVPLVQLGVVDIEYRRVACRYPKMKLTVKIDESSKSPDYLALVIWFQQGKKDITAVQLCEIDKYECKLMQRSHGAVWATTSPPNGPLTMKMLFSSEKEDDERWVETVNIIPQRWEAGNTYDTGVQVN